MNTEPPGLLPLSLQRAPAAGKRMPHVPTAADRLRAWHNARDPQPGNGVTDWRELAEQARAYAREQAMDGAPEVTDYAERRGV